MTRALRRLWRALVGEWGREDRLHMREVAHRYGERAAMDGWVVRRTGEVVPRESA